MIAIRRIDFAVLCSATVTDEFELQLTKTGAKARNWMTMFRRNWTSIRTFQSSSGRNWKHILLHLNEDVTKMGRKTYNCHLVYSCVFFNFLSEKFGENPLKILTSWANEFGDLMSFSVGPMVIVVISDREMIREAFQNPDFNHRPRSRIVEENMGLYSSGNLLSQ